MSKGETSQYAKEIIKLSFLIILIILPGSLLSIPTIVWVSKKLDLKLISTDFKNKKTQTNIEHR